MGVDEAVGAEGGVPGRGEAGREGGAFVLWIGVSLSLRGPDAWRRTASLVLVEAEEAELEGGHVRVDEEGEDLVGRAKVGALVAFGMGGDGVGHPLEYGICSKRAGHGRRAVDGRS